MLSLLCEATGIAVFLATAPILITAVDNIPTVGDTTSETIREKFQPAAFKFEDLQQESSFTSNSKERSALAVSKSCATDSTAD